MNSSSHPCKPSACWLSSPGALIAQLLLLLKIKSRWLQKSCPPPAASSNLCTHPRRCAHATDYQNHLNALFLRHRDWELNSQLNWGLASYLILLDSSSSRQFTANIRFLTLTCWQDTCQSLLPCLVHLLPFTSALEHIYLEQIKLS